MERLVRVTRQDELSLLAPAYEIDELDETYFDRFDTVNVDRVKT